MWMQFHLSGYLDRCFRKKAGKLLHDRQVSTMHQGAWKKDYSGFDTYLLLELSSLVYGQNSTAGRNCCINASLNRMTMLASMFALT